MKFVLHVPLILVSLSALPAVAGIIPLSLPNAVAACDDCSSSAVPINLDGASGLNFFGQSFTNLFVNNNGNVTFVSGLSQYTPNGLAQGIGQPIIAPFFADVDTRGTGTVTYGNVTVNGESAFAVDWNAVGYYDSATDKTNTFQMILYDRTDTGPGNFDIQFNYGSMQWETGDASGGTDGLGGTSAVAGYSNGLSGPNNVYYQLPGSLQNGALIDGGPDSLMTLGSVTFDVRNGNVTSATPEPSTILIGMTGLALLAGYRRLTRLERS